MTQPTNRRLIGFLWTSDDEFNNQQPKIVERWFQDGIEHEELVWEGTFLTGVMSHEEEDLRNELADACTKYDLEETHPGEGMWERYL